MRETTARANRREDLLVAAARRFVDVGLRRTTMEDIAREAGAGTATLYRHFANKPDLIDALLAHDLIAGDWRAEPPGPTPAGTGGSRSCPAGRPS